MLQNDASVSLVQVGNLDDNIVKLKVLVSGDNSNREIWGKIAVDSSSFDNRLSNTVLTPKSFSITTNSSESNLQAIILFIKPSIGMEAFSNNTSTFLTPITTTFYLTDVSCLKNLVK